LFFIAAVGAEVGSQTYKASSLALFVFRQCIADRSFVRFSEFIIFSMFDIDHYLIEFSPLHVRVRSNSLTSGVEVEQCSTENRGQGSVVLEGPLVAAGGFWHSAEIPLTRQFVVPPNI
jgi:hypothetical protein